MTDDRSDDDARFLEELRGESRQGVGRGLGRLARLVRGGTGLAHTLLAGPRGDAAPAMSARELARLEALVARLGALKGLPMKLGQIISYLELELPDEARRLFAHLQRRSAATSAPPSSGPAWPASSCPARARPPATS